MESNGEKLKIQEREGVFARAMSLRGENVQVEGLALERSAARPSVGTGGRAEAGQERREERH